MAVSEANNITITGIDWSNKLRDVALDCNLLAKIIHWHGNEDLALRWVQLQIKLFSNRQPKREGLSQIISSIAFVEMANPRAAGIVASLNGEELNRMNRKTS